MCVTQQQCVSLKYVEPGTTWALQSTLHMFPILRAEEANIVVHKQIGPPHYTVYPPMGSIENYFYTWPLYGGVCSMPPIEASYKSEQ